MVRHLADNDTLPALRTTSGRRLFRRADVEALAARRALMPGRRRHAA
jgi:DNA-binding transcriptional MerR regulator